MITLDDLHSQAVYLHAFAQGMDELNEQIKAEISPAANAMPAMFQSLIERADILANDLEDFAKQERGK